MNDDNTNYLAHHGILGMRWGVRRYQNKDGSLTAAGKARYDKVANSSRLQKKEKRKAIKSLSLDSYNAIYFQREASKKIKKLNKKLKKLKEQAKKKGENLNDNKQFKNLNEKLELYNKEYKLAGETFIKSSALLSEIKTEKIKAGVDYITNSDWDFNSIIIPKLYVNAVQNNKLRNGYKAIWVEFKDKNKVSTDTNSTGSLFKSSNDHKEHGSEHLRNWRRATKRNIGN